MSSLGRGPICVSCRGKGQKARHTDLARPVFFGWCASGSWLGRGHVRSGWCLGASRPRKPDRDGAVNHPYPPPHDLQPPPGPLGAASVTRSAGVDDAAVQIDIDAGLCTRADAKVTFRDISRRVYCAARSEFTAGGSTRDHIPRLYQFSTDLG